MARGMQLPYLHASAARVINYICQKPKPNKNSRNKNNLTTQHFHTDETRPKNLNAGNIGTLEPSHAIRVLEKIAHNRPDIKKPFIHYAIAYPHDEPRSPQEMLKHLSDFLRHLQLDGYAWVARIHERNHIHVLICCISLADAKLYNRGKIARKFWTALKATDPSPYRATQRPKVNTPPLRARESANARNDISIFEFVAFWCIDSLAAARSISEFRRNLDSAGISTEIVYPDTDRPGIVYSFQGYRWSGSRLSRYLALPAISSRLPGGLDKFICAFTARREAHRLAPPLPDLSLCATLCPRVQPTEVEAPPKPLKLADALELARSITRRTHQFRLLPDGSWIMIIGGLHLRIWHRRIEFRIDSRIHQNAATAPIRAAIDLMQAIASARGWHDLTIRHAALAHLQSPGTSTHSMQPISVTGGRRPEIESTLEVHHAVISETFPTRNAARADTPQAEISDHIAERNDPSFGPDPAPFPAARQHSPRPLPATNTSPTASKPPVAIGSPRPKPARLRPRP